MHLVLLDGRPRRDGENSLQVRYLAGRDEHGEWAATNIQRL